MRILDSLNFFLAKQLVNTAAPNSDSCAQAASHLKNWLDSSFNEDTDTVQLQINKLIEIQSNSNQICDRELSIYSSVLLAVICSFNHHKDQANTFLQSAIKINEECQNSEHRLSIPIALSQALMMGISFPVMELKSELRRIIELASQSDCGKQYFLETLLCFCRLHLSIAEHQGENAWLATVEEVLTKSDEIAQINHPNDPVLLARLLQLHAHLCYVQKDYDRSDEQLRRALATAEVELGAYHPYRTELLIDQALSLEKLGKYQHATEVARNAELCESGGSANKLRLSIVSFRIGQLMQLNKENPRDCFAVLKKSLTLSEEYADGSKQDRLNILHVMKATARAASMNREILEVAAQIASLDLLIHKERGY